ncbi:MAG: NUDIX hydrolase [Candidatus Hodarchaeales archaeon]
MKNLPECLKNLNRIIKNYSRLEIDVPEGYQKASVLVPIVKREKNWNLIFIRRSSKVSKHKGEISFPGGRFDESIDHNPTETALREMYEEIGVKNVEIIGLLDDIITITRYIVTPVVGFIKDNSEIDSNCIDPNETEYIIEAPINHLSQPQNFFLKEVEYDKGIIFQVPFFNFEGETIWGATGRILVNLLNEMKKLDNICRVTLMGSDSWREQENEVSSLNEKTKIKRKTS